MSEAAVPPPGEFLARLDARPFRLAALGTSPVNGGGKALCGSAPHPENFSRRSMHAPSASLRSAPPP
jgi:hypothetical protein